VISTLVVVVSDLLSFLKSSFRSRTALLAENLFLRKQLTFYQEHKSIWAKAGRAPVFGLAYRRPCSSPSVAGFQSEDEYQP
jgi:hypothetical protein